jgi:hypothetical protein
MSQKNKRYRFCLRPSASPTFYNLHVHLQQQGFRSCRSKWLTRFNEAHFQFNPVIAEQLEFKHLLAQLIAEYCPHVMPKTYCINDKNWPQILSLLAEQYDMNAHPLVEKASNLVWILKPSLLNNGQHIQIFNQISQLEQHYMHSNRLGGEHVLQRYISEPHLLKGHKYSIRLFVIVTNYAGIFLYPDGYFNVARQAYRPTEFSDLSPHLTNEHLSNTASNVIQIPTNQFDFFPVLLQQIQTIITDTFDGLQAMQPTAFQNEKNRSLAIFGFDFIVDSQMKVWLLEANHGPCFPTTDDHPLQKYLYDKFWEAFISSFVRPIAMRQPVDKTKFSPFIRTVPNAKRHENALASII